MTNKRIRLTIGEFSRLCYATVKTLRHYEKVGLLIPHEVDEWTGYRYYNVEQMGQMVRIKELKSLGLSLEEIKDLIEERLTQPDDDLIRIKIEETEEKLCSLRKRLSALESLKKGAKKQTTMSKIVIKPLPGGIVASWRSVINGYQELGNKLCNVVMPEMQRLSCVCPEETAYCFTMDHNNNHNPEIVDVEYCEIVEERKEDTEILKFKELPICKNAVCTEHRGGYDSFDKTMLEVFAFIEKSNWVIDGMPRFCYIHGIWDCDSESDWLTEVQIPVKKE